MGYGVLLTLGDGFTPFTSDELKMLVEARVEMELSKPSRFALRFEDDICTDKHEIADKGVFKKNVKIGMFVDTGTGLECLIYGVVAKLRTSSMLGGPGSWTEVHGEDRRLEMGKAGVQATYAARVSDVVKQIVGAYKFEVDAQDTLVEHDKQKAQLTQSTTDLAFVEDAARRNNFEFWISYVVKASPIGGIASVIETAHFATSPKRSQAGDIPQIPVLIAKDNKVLRVNPPAAACPNVSKFDARINFEKPTSATGFAMDGDREKNVVAEIGDAAKPVDPERPLAIKGLDRTIITPAAVTPTEKFLATEAIVNEQSWFVEIDCSATLEQLDFIVRPHQIVKVENAGPGLTGAYQVMKATHVITATDHFMDFTLRANGLGEYS